VIQGAAPAAKVVKKPWLLPMSRNMSLSRCDSGKEPAAREEEEAQEGRGRVRGEAAGSQRAAAGRAARAAASAPPRLQRSAHAPPVTKQSFSLGRSAHVSPSVVESTAEKRSMTCSSAPCSQSTTPSELASRWLTTKKAEVGQRGLGAPAVCPAPGQHSRQSSSPGFCTIFSSVKRSVAKALASAVEGGSATHGAAADAAAAAAASSSSSAASSACEWPLYCV